MKALTPQFISDAITIRHRLHQIPELKYEEQQTSSFIASTLTSYGYEIKSGIGKTGIVAVLDSGKPGRTIAFRADIDALPIHELTEVPYKSQHHGKMHACGHDGHTATLLLVARALQQIKSQLKGKIKLIFQPAEEGGKGSTAMIQDGVLENPHVDAIFGYHNWPGLPLNTLATRTGCILAGSGRFEIVIHGKKAHLAMPQDAINPVTIGAAIVKHIEALSVPATVINLLSFNTGNWKEGLSERAEIVGCYFVEDSESLNELKTHLQSIVASFGTIDFHEYQSATLNSPKETDLVLSAASLSGLKEILHPKSPKMAAEDFSEYLKHVPGCFFLIGAGDLPPLHTPLYDFPDAILAPTAQLMLQIAISGNQP